VKQREREERESWTYSPEGRRREHRGRSPEDRWRGEAVAGGEEQRAESTEGEVSLWLGRGLEAIF
jgi:hypothetical protein